MSPSQSNWFLAALVTTAACYGSSAKGGAAPDGGVLDCAAFLSAVGCAAYTNATDAGDSRAVTFSDFSFSPKCLRVKVGQSVTFSGSFSSHPLAQACGPASAISNGPGPFTFSVPGAYGFNCTAHGAPDGTGMAGAIDVVP